MRRSWRAISPRPSSLLPPGEAANAQLLSIFELEKAVYELRYELNNRPDWVRIPVAGIVRLLEYSSDVSHRRPGHRGLVELRLGDPHRVLGAHPSPDGVTVRAFGWRPSGSSCAPRARPRSSSPAATRRASSRARCPAPSCPALRAGGQLPRRLELHPARPVRLPADARRPRPAPRRRGSPRAALPAVRCARPRARGRHRDRLRGLGAQRLVA